MEIERGARGEGGRRILRNGWRAKFEEEEKKKEERMS